MKLLSSDRIIPLLFFLSLSVQVFCQSNADKNKNTPVISYGRPNIPGELGFDFGIVYAPDFPDAIKISLLRSLYFSPYYRYEFFIPKTRFSILTGLSVGCEKFRFKDAVTVQYLPDAEYKFSDQVVRLDTVYYNSPIRKSKLQVNYLEIPLELRFRSNKNYPRSSFNISVGGKVGLLINAHTKINYVQSGVRKTVKQAESFDLSPIRYGLEGRIGFGPFNVFYYYSLNTMFKKNRGPDGNISKPVLLGISFSLF